MTVDRKIINDLDFQSAHKVKNAVDGVDPQDYATVGQVDAVTGDVASVFGRTGAVLAVTGDYYGAVAAALTGATQASRYCGATASGAPVSGTFVTGDWVVARDGAIYICTSGGTPGTWTSIGGGASFATPAVVLGASAAAGSAGTVIRSDSTIAAFDATAPSTQAFGDSAAVGTAAFAARRDHKHAMPATPSSVSGNAGTATALQTSRNIDGQAFDGTANITVIAPGTHAATAKSAIIDADEHPVVDTAASNVLKKYTGTDLKAYLKTYFDTLYTGSGTGMGTDGWITLGALTYSSVDGPTGVVTTTGDISGTVGVGSRVKFTQTTVKYFIVTAIDSTTMTLYGGTDYALVNAAISSPSWSPVKAPHGFPLSPAKWTVEVSDTSQPNKATPTGSTFYGDTGLSPTGVSLSIPIGVWNIRAGALCYATRATQGTLDPILTLSSSASAAGPSDLYGEFRATVGTGTTQLTTLSLYLNLTGLLTLAAKTTYYLVVAISAGTVTNVGYNGTSPNPPTLIRAVCAYL